MKELTTKQLDLIKLIIARFKSKSPKGYQKLLNVCVWVSSIMGLYIFAHDALALMPASWEPWAGGIDKLFIVAGAAFSALGIGAASTTTDPALMSKDTKDAVTKDILNNQ